MLHSHCCHSKVQNKMHHMFAHVDSFPSRQTQQWGCEGAGRVLQELVVFFTGFVARFRFKDHFFADCGEAFTVVEFHSAMLHLLLLCKNSMRLLVVIDLAFVQPSRSVPKRWYLVRVSSHSAVICCISVFSVPVDSGRGGDNKKGILLVHWWYVHTNCWKYVRLHISSIRVAHPFIIRSLRQYISLQNTYGFHYSRWVEWACFDCGIC